MSEPKYQDPTVAYNTGYADGQRDAYRILAKVCAAQADGPTERALVVAWLKDVERGPIAHQLALRIEKGEHVKASA